ncbi:MAG: pseudaminic acid synthase [Sphingomonadales bacterium]|nr:pseudaminic acid synthase [Sphingomonadales bacterium]
MTATITIAGRQIGPGLPPYVIAEMSANHNGSIDAAFRIIEEAKKAGADAIKIQTYRPDTLTIDCDRPEFRIEGGLWHGKTLYELYQWAHTPWEWHADLFAQAKAAGIVMFSSPFDETAVDLLEKLGCPAYKIASFEAVDTPLIRYVAQTKKPMIISTGLANAAEIEDAIAAAKGGGCRELAILHCVSGYPAPARDYNLRTLPDMTARFGLPVGLSDHTLGNTTAIAAVALGACLIEKHFTLNRDGGGPDDSFSLEPGELAALVRDARTAWEALGEVSYERKESEKGNLIFRRSLCAVKDIKKGEVFTRDNVRSIRPGYGLAPKELPNILGKTAERDYERGEGVDCFWISPKT